MAKKKQPSLRYYVRFKDHWGHLRAVIRNGSTRKYITTPIVITPGLAERLDSAGYLRDRHGRSECIWETQLKRFTACVWRVVDPLISLGEFDTTTSKQLSEAVNFLAEEEAGRRIQKAAEAILAKKGGNNGEL